MSLLLEIAQLPRATFYYHLKRMQKADKYAQEKAEISAIYHENKGRYGYRRITMVLRSRGFFLNHKTVQRLMRELGLFCRVRVKKYRSYKGEVGKIAPNLLNRDFHAEKPNQKWVTDVTEFSLFGTKLYLSPILDLHSGYLVSYSISERPVLSMVTAMLDKAFVTIPDGTDLILHSDQGWQYQHKQYQRMLRKKGIRQSMSRKGNCLDNAVMENFFGLLMDQAPVLTASSPSFGNIHHSQIQHFQQAVISRKHGFGFCHLAQLAVKSFNGVGGVDQAPYLLGILEVGAEIGSVGSLGLGDFREFLIPALPKGIQSVQGCPIGVLTDPS